MRNIIIQQRVRGAKYVTSASGKSITVKMPGK